MRVVKIENMVFIKTTKMHCGLIVFICVTLLDYSFGSGDCPHKCVCDRKRVDCAHKGLLTIPRGIPRSVKKL